MTAFNPIKEIGTHVRAECNYKIGIKIWTDKGEEYVQSCY